LTRFDRSGGEEKRNYAFLAQCSRTYREDQHAHPRRKVPQTFQSIMEDLQPEAAYFTDIDGARGAYFIVNVEEPSEMASKTETLLKPFFKGWGRR
jgi:hypothetical protein